MGEWIQSVNMQNVSFFLWF